MISAVVPAIAWIVLSYALLQNAPHFPTARDIAIEVAKLLPKPETENRKPVLSKAEPIKPESTLTERKVDQKQARVIEPQLIVESANDPMGTIPQTNQPVPPKVSKFAGIRVSNLGEKRIADVKVIVIQVDDVDYRLQLPVSSDANLFRFPNPPPVAGTVNLNPGDDQSFDAVVECNGTFECPMGELAISPLNKRDNRVCQCDQERSYYKDKRVKSKSVRRYRTGSDSDFHGIAKFQRSINTRIQIRRTKEVIFTSAQCRNFQHETLPNLTVSLSLIHDVAAGTAREFSDNGPGQILTQGGDKSGTWRCARRTAPWCVILGVGKVFFWRFFF